MPHADIEMGAPIAAGTVVDPASLPYAGTSGWSGTDASRERAESRDSSGQTASVQSGLVLYAFTAGQRGITIKEARDRFGSEHHGTLSGALTALHKAGRLLRLAEKRDRCSVYVAPQFLLGREVVPPATRPRLAKVEIGAEMDAEFIGHQIIAALSDSDQIIVSVQR